MKRAARMGEAGGAVGAKYKARKKADSSIRKAAKKNENLVEARSREYARRAKAGTGAKGGGKRRAMTADQDPVMRKLKQQKQLRKQGRGYSRYS